MKNSKRLFSEAQQYIPGGVNSPVRAFKAVGGEPVFFKRGKGARLEDADGNHYIDYVGSWGPMVAGHAHPKVIAAVQRAALQGLGFGAPTEIETTLAKCIHQAMPSLEKLRMVNSGTEATMSALRLARGYTGRDTVVKFEGCYHGHADPFLVKAGSGALTLGVPTSPGVPAEVAAHTVTLSYNDLAQVTDLFAAQGDSVAAVIVEPVAGNMNCIPPAEGFLAGLREVTAKHGSVLIFDEVMTGFRVALGGAQALYRVTPDLTTLGKVIGGGLPVGAFGGRTEIMQQLAPTGPVYQAGTLSGNPIAMAAGLATLGLVSEPGFYDALSAQTECLVNGLREAALAAHIPLTTNQVGGMFGLFFSEDREISRFSQVMACDQERFRRFFQGMLKAGIYLAPSPFEAGFVSSAHGEEEIDTTLAAATEVFAGLQG